MEVSNDYFHALEIFRKFQENWKQSGKPINFRKSKKFSGKRKNHCRPSSVKKVSNEYFHTLEIFIEIPNCLQLSYLSISSLSVFVEASLQVWPEMKQTQPFQDWESLSRSIGEDFLHRQSLDFSASPLVSLPPTFVPGQLWLHDCDWIWMVL